MFKWLKQPPAPSQESATEDSRPLLGMSSMSKDGNEIEDNIPNEEPSPFTPPFDINSPEAVKVLRKIDFHVIPLLFITYNLNFMDKTILSSAAVFGLSEDTHLEGQQYSWVSSFFYFGYFFWEYPTTWLIQKLPVGKYVGVNTITWGIVVALTALCTNYNGLLAVRFLLGVAEATISPAFVFITSTWYTRSEIPVRTGIWFAGNSMGGVLSSFVAYGLGHITHPLHPWQWLFIVLGLATFLWGFVLLLFLPDSIVSASFLNPTECAIAIHRVRNLGTGTILRMYKPDQVLECLKDPKTYFIFFISLLTQIPNSGTQNFGNLVLRGFGFTSLQSTLIILPASVISFVSIVATGWLAGKYINISTYLICLVVILPIIGSAMIYAEGESKSVKLFAYYLLSTGSTALPLLLSLVGVNFKGSTKKMTVTAILFLAYCMGNILGPHFFRTSEAPKYETAFEAIMISYSLVVVLAMSMRGYLAGVNKKREMERILEVRDLEDEDKTDFQTKGFRYRM